MGYHYRTYLGPAYRILKKVWTLTEPTLYTSCVNKKCENFKKNYLNGDFCSKCGSKYETVTKNSPVNLWGKMSDDLGEDIFQILNWHSDPDEYFFASNFTDHAGKSYSPSEEAAVEITPEKIQTEMAAFKVQTRALYEWLCKHVGEENVTLAYYMKGYGS